MAYASRKNASTLPQGFSIYQPNLGAQLQFLPAIGTPELDELINAYVAGPATTQEKRASVSLDFLEYAHVTGQTFKFYPVYSVNAAVESPATDSSYGSSFNASPVTSNWDFNRISTSLSPPSQQARTSSKTASSRQQTTDFSNLPGMKIMTKDGRDVTNSASRGSKTKEQRDHAHLMRIIKACDSCRRKKIRCDPSHKKRAASQSQSQSQSTTKSIKKTKAVAEAVQPASAAAPPVNIPVQAPQMALDQTFNPIDIEGFTSSLPALEPWEEFIDYSSADVSDEYDFFNDPAGYFSPQSASSSISAYSTKPVTPTSQQDLSDPNGIFGGETSVTWPQLPFIQSGSTANYVDFNLFSPESNSSEDEHMALVDLSRYLSNRSCSPQPGISQSDQSLGGSDAGFDLIGLASDPATWSMSSRQSGEDNNYANTGTYRDPGASDEGQDCYSPLSLSMNSEGISHNVTESTTVQPVSNNAGYSMTPSSVGNNLDQSSSRRSMDATATAIANTETSAGSPIEDERSEKANDSCNRLTTSTSDAIHRLKGLHSPAMQAGQCPPEVSVIVPQAESLSQDMPEVAVAVTTTTTTNTRATNATTTTTTTGNEHGVPMSDIVIPSASLQPQDQKGLCEPVASAERSALSQMTGAGATSAMEVSVVQCIATSLCAIIALAAVGAWFQKYYQRLCSASDRSSFGRRLHVGVCGSKSSPASRNGGLQTLWDRVRSSQRQSPSGIMAVNRIISRSSSLVAF